MVVDGAVGEAGGAEAVFAGVLCLLAAGDEAAFEVGVLLYRDVVAVVSCIQPALFGDAGVAGLEVALAVVAGGRDAREEKQPRLIKEWAQSRGKRLERWHRVTRHYHLAMSIHV